MKNTTASRITALLATSLAIALGGCSSNQQNDSFVSWDQINQEYLDTVASYPYKLPPGATFPSDLGEPEYAKEVYQPGFGAMQAYFFAQCAEEKVVVANHSSHKATAVAALDAIDQIHQLPVFQKHVDDSGGEWKGIMDKARLGDYSQLVNFYNSDCASPWYHDNGA